MFDYFSTLSVLENRFLGALVDLWLLLKETQRSNGLVN